MPYLTFHLAYRLPANCPPQRVVDSLHRYEPLITPNPSLVAFRRRPFEVAEIVNDPFFREDGQALVAFEVVEDIVLVPGVIAKRVVIPCVMQQFEGGVRCRSLAAGGVRVWSTWKVVAAAGPPRDPAPSKYAALFSRASRDRGPRRDSSSSRPSTRQASPQPTAPAPAATPPPHSTTALPTHGEGYEIVEDARVECGPLVKSFVGRKFRESHMQILRKVVEDALTRMECEKMSYVYM
ncbi:hypothetical protein SEPCBS119000_002140 [Sporothrix epigloea]|uniref:DUF7053 domain-containing protein n=1 Tax=Sporothrix epigloea TaxID=1892477 RepID=A0ABP0DEI5_9PEZI